MSKNHGLYKAAPQIEGMVPVVYRDELLGYIPDCGEEIHNVNSGKSFLNDIMLRKVGIKFNDSVSLYYFAIGGRCDVLNFIWDAGFINQELHEEIHHFSNNMLDCALAS